MVKKGLSLAPNTVVIITILILAMAVIIYYFITISGGYFNPLIEETNITKVCEDWKYQGYSNEFFCNNEILRDKFGNPIKAKDYCQSLGIHQLNIHDCTSSNLCGATTLTNCPVCCCKIAEGCESTNPCDCAVECYWSKYC